MADALSPRRRSRRWLVLGVLFAAASCLVPASEAECAAVMTWVAGQALPAGAHDRTLPDTLGASSQDGRVRVLVGPDGRRCLLLKRQIGYKDNFDGTLYCDAPVRSDEVVERPGGPAIVSIAGDAEFEELYVRTRHGDRHFAVYFDLH
ncbi:hypothetical protein [Nannocystis sp. SCPEA4]|uniref:hypothetical protein n=1 Tax=Nannocystis sp. SCPEA4 TaxID=2996787 RepID=UPI00226E4356|nr:hypothetical protein [Nannocystis sp. SCPEA4]MCY1061117.1 hypothetical protein [Nannocystis sp. SCPEA4]